MINIQDSDNVVLSDCGSKVKITDSNNKVFEMSIDEINDFSTDKGQNTFCNISDSYKNMVNFKPTIIDNYNLQDEKKIDENALIDLIQNGEVVALDIDIEATHSGENENSFVYASESMVEDSNSFMFPYKKPLLKNHDMYTEPLGRVVSANCAPSEFDSNKDTIDVTFKVTDKDAMLKFADGRYNTVSIGAKANDIKCNLCGKDILKNNKFTFCGHWRGESYAGKTATWTCKDLVYKETSVVNSPADPLAQVKRIKVIKRNGGANNMSDNTNQTNTGVGSVIDNIIGNQNEPKNDPTNNDNNNKEPNVNNNEPVNNTNDSEKIKELEDKITTLTKEVNDAKAETEAIRQAKTLDEQQLALKDSEIAENKKIILSLATYNKELLKDCICALDKNITKDSLSEENAQSLENKLNQLKDSAQTSTSTNTNNDSNNSLPKPVQNPGGFVKDNHTVVDDENGEPKQNTSTKQFYDGIQDNIINKMCR